MHKTTKPPLLTLTGNMRTITFLFLFYLQLPCSFKSCLARDFLNPGQNITGTTSVLVSAGQRFVLGFFSPAGNPTETYLGIWYYQSQTFSSELPTVVWVANRDKPILNSHVGVFQIAGDGNLVVKDKDGSSSKSYYWSSELEGSSSRNRTVKLMDSGNLVLFQNDENIWQSFQHPTDTFLPGMKMDTTMELTCWSGDSDPRPGNFTFKIMSQTAGDNPRYIILKNNKLYWESSGQNEDLNPDSEFDAVAYFLSNFSSSTKQGNLSPTNYENKRLLMNSTGELQFRTREGFQGDWSFFWKAPQSFCDSYNACGNFSTCKDNNGERCKCLPGFNQVSGSNYCARKSAASSWCGEGIRFLNLVMVKVRNPDIYYTEANESDCKNKCLQMCPKCQAYSYSVPQDTTRRDLSFSTCRIWTHDLITLQEGYFGRNLSVRVDISDIEATPRSCEPCGANIVPYPLSTGRNCGDPLYFTFSCNRSTGDLSFVPTTTSDGYTVISIDADSRKFVIKVTSAETYCNLQTRNDKTLQIHFPFNVTNECRTEDEVEVTWLPPSEPICNESVDCKGWNHSTCEKTGDSNRCLCNSNYRWNNASLNCDSNEAIAIAGGTEQKVRKENSKSQKSLIIGVTLGSVVVLACAVVSAYLCRRKITYKKDKDKIQRNRGRFYDSERHVKDLMEVEGFEEKDHEDIEVPYFDFESILIATDNFSDANKLGRGGYGPVYKGKLQDEVVAVKRLSSISSQGLLEFKNEVVLIAKLQHRNLVRLRGYCIKGEEKILLYEYMPNKSLDSFIFDPKQSVHLDWQIRFDIILGVARGILYLHQDSRLRVIHRDLKTSNILLDKMMQPKISDFGLARIVGGKETETNTERVVGTYGYMSPEYALDGLFSTKSDVFSFGVVLLEIISGKKNTGFYQSSQVPSLLGYAWKLWTENKLIDLMYMSLVESCTENQFIRCAHVALLCVQDEPGDRPSMSSVVTMLDSETSTLPTPKQPTFFASRGQPTTSSTKDFLNVGENITGTTSVLSSAKNKFVLGFFSPPGSPTRSYLGIWYNQSQYPGPQTVIWVANRDNPISNPNVGVFRIANDGRITVTDTSGSGQTCYWSSRNEASTSRNRTVKLFDSGNLVLMMVLDEAIIYQSFLHPTDTFLAGMKMDSEVKLTSWSSDDNPRTGSFTFQIAGDGDDYSYKYKYNPSYAILKNWQRYWESGKHLDSDFDAIISYMLTNFSTGTNTSDNFDNTMLVMKNTGELKLLVWDSFGHDWLVRWKAPASPCDQYNFCGHFTSCNGNNYKPCNCLPGFKRAEVSDENNGCVRRTATEESCGGGGGEGRSAFLELVKVKPGIPDGKYPAENESECKERCLQNCSHCQAYSYVEADVNGYRCWIWTQELDTVQDVEDDHLRNLFVRLDKSDI
ncbi:hypothetical protein S245_062435, partial [Arachis hypogaea]